jgi:LysM repeat protein
LATSGSSSQQSAANPTLPFGVTITVRPPMTPTPLPTEPPAVRIAVQPTVAPTPTLYTVEEDDTLIDIAFQFGITVEDIQLANPEVDPRVLQIGQVLVIPVTTPGVDGQRVPVEPPPPLSLTNPTCYQTPTRSVMCLGLIENPLEQPVERVQVAVQILGNDGVALGERIATTEQMVVPPGGQAPYRVQFGGISETQIAGVVAELTGGNLLDVEQARYILLDVQNPQVTASGQLFRFTGEVTNTTESVLAAPRAVLTLTDPGDNVYGYRVWDAPGELIPGETLSLNIPVRPFGLNGTSPLELSYNLHIESFPLPTE